MPDARIASVLVAVLLLAVTVAAGAAVFGVDPADVASAVAGPDADAEPPVSPAVTSFTAASGVCVDRPRRNSSIALRSTANNSYVVVEQNATVPDSSHTVRAERLVRTGPRNYTLSVATSETDGPNRDCSEAAQVRYEASLQVPHGDDEPFAVVIRHDGERVGAVYNGADGSGASAGGSAGWTDEDGPRRTGRFPRPPV